MVEKHCCLLATGTDQISPSENSAVFPLHSYHVVADDCLCLAIKKQNCTINTRSTCWICVISYFVVEHSPSVNAPIYSQPEAQTLQNSCDICDQMPWTVVEIVEPFSVEHGTSLLIWLFLKKTFLYTPTKNTGYSL